MSELTTSAKMHLGRVAVAIENRAQLLQSNLIGSLGQPRPTEEQIASYLSGLACMKRKSWVLYVAPPGLLEPHRGSIGNGITLCRERDTRPSVVADPSKILTAWHLTTGGLLITRLA